MPYAVNFQHADDLITDIEAQQSSTNALLQAKYSGVVSVLASSVYECAIKDILLEFARSRDTIFYNYVNTSFSKLNARIKLANLKDDYLNKFGVHYKANFIDLLNNEEDKALRDTGASITQSYSNLIQWRHDFVHAARCPAYASLEEAIASYKRGKVVVECFYVTLAA